MKLHLGCGQVYLDGYINIDYPRTHQNVQDVKADVYKDIKKLNYRANTVSEIRSHHVFEHFDRPTALALICRWRTWLKPGGILRIETPDVMTSYKLMTSPFISYEKKQEVMRHLHGSHEAGWAAHWDGWYKDKYKFTLIKLGFDNITFKYNKWGMLRNIEVSAKKSMQSFSKNDFKRSSVVILKNSTVRVKTENPKEPEGTEKKLLQYWIKVWDVAYQQGK